MMKKTLLSLSISLVLLSGCGGSDSSGSADDPVDSATKSIAVIDGYLENADIYVDSNSDGIADADEKLEVTTDADGKVTISLSDAEFDLIAQINGDTTKDSDGTGTVGRSYQMIAKAGLDFITPFTTIAKVQNKTLAEVATDLDLDESVIAGDYIVQKDALETSDDAKIAHAYARNLTTTLPSNIADNNEENISRFIETIQDDIEQAINSDIDLDSVISEVVTLEDILVEGNTFFSVAVNSNINSDEDVSITEYVTSSGYKFSNDKGSFYGEYIVEGNQATYDGENFMDSIAFVSQNNYISITQEGILDVVSRTVAAQDISSAMFTGTTWYQLFDDGVASTQPCIMKVQFTSATEMKYVEDEDFCEVSDSDGGTDVEYPYHWVVNNNELSIYDDETGVEGGEADFIITSNSERLLVVQNTNTQRRSLFLKDKALAESVFATWSHNL
jgi:hypothetical protein